MYSSGVTEYCETTSRNSSSGQRPALQPFTTCSCKAKGQNHRQSLFLQHGETTSPRFAGGASHGISPLHGKTRAQTTLWSADADTAPGSHQQHKVATCDQRCPVPAGEEEERSHEKRRGRVFWKEKKEKKKPDMECQLCSSMDRQ